MTEAKIKIWHIPQVPGKAFEVVVPDLATAVLLCNTLAQYDLFQYENNIKPDYANANGISILFSGETEWESIDPDDEYDLEYAAEQLDHHSPLLTE